MAHAASCHCLGHGADDRALGREEIGNLINRRMQEYAASVPRSAAVRPAASSGSEATATSAARAAQASPLGAIADDDADRLLRVEQGGGCGPARVTRDPRDGNHGGLPGCAWPF